MGTTIVNNEPKALWQHFYALNQIPRASKKEAQVVAFIKKFGEDLGLETTSDEVGNVIIKKPGSVGKEHQPIVALQSHLDMVHQKNAATIFDFATQAIEMYQDGDWIKANGTTLGADNGIGVAAIMSIFADKNAVHPPLEALFTIDEETGMTGAFHLKAGMLHAQVLLNLDTEEDTDLTIGCAGGLDITCTGQYLTTATPQGYSFFTLSLTGLTGGHSGGDIHLGRANANKQMARLLYSLQEKTKFVMHRLEGGSLRNAIPREAQAVLGIDTANIHVLEHFLKEYEAILKNEFHITDPHLTLQAQSTDAPTVVWEQDFQQQLLCAIYACPYGIYRMSPAIKDLVQSSNNLSKIVIAEGAFNIQCLTRSSVETEKQDLANAITAALSGIKGTMSYTGAYPGWEPKPDAPIVHLMQEKYKALFNEEPHVNAVHAGLECGIIGRNYPNMQMISFGPNIFGAHSPDERVQISSVQKFWKFLNATLADL